MTASPTCTLLALDLAAVTEAWRSSALDTLCAARPGGRLAALLAAPVEGVIIDCKRTAAAALAPVTLGERREVFDALAEDLALAALFDAPAEALAVVLGALGRLAKRTDLGLAGDEAFAYPDDLLEDPGVQSSDRSGGLTTWLSGPPQIPAALAALPEALAAADTAWPGLDPRLARDLLEALAPLLRAAEKPAVVIVARRE